MVGPFFFFFDLDQGHILKFKPGGHPALVTRQGESEYAKISYFRRLALRTRGATQIIIQKIPVKVEK